jgi:hypothetical protein
MPLLSAFPCVRDRSSDLTVRWCDVSSEMSELTGLDAMSLVGEWDSVTPPTPHRNLQFAPSATEVTGSATQPRLSVPSTELTAVMRAKEVEAEEDRARWQEGGVWKGNGTEASPAATAPPNTEPEKSTGAVEPVLLQQQQAATRAHKSKRAHAKEPTAQSP